MGVAASMKRVYRRHRCPGRLAQSALAVLCLSLPAQAQAGQLYRWVDAHGNVHFTDQMPAEAVKQRHTVMDYEGNVLEDRETLHEERARRAEREAQRVEEERLAEEVRRTREEQQRRDRIITQTFSTERDIRLTEETRIELVDVQIRIVEHGIRQLQQQREEEVARYRKLDADAPAAAEVLARIDDIDTRLHRRLEQRRDLVAKRTTIEQKFAYYLDRFRELNRVD